MSALSYIWLPDPDSNQGPIDKQLARPDSNGYERTPLLHPALHGYDDVTSKHIKNSAQFIDLSHSRPADICAVDSLMCRVMLNEYGVIENSVASE